MSFWSDARNLLCIRLDSLGDVIMTTPALRALKASPFIPKVTLLTSPSGAAAARLIPEIDEVILYEAPWMKATAPRPFGAEDKAVVRRLKQAKFDGAVLFTTYSQSPLPAAMLCYQAGIPHRLAYCRENPYQLLTDWFKETEPEKHVRHEARRHLDLVASVGYRAADERLSFSVPPEARSRMLAILQAKGLPVLGGMIVIHPGATAPSRRYAAAGFAEVMKLLHEHIG
ncbi:MAG: Lipopolysaccharide heptosyltransferase, partial [Verrucomicrobiaceae bacterium]|nr:Lipopolysaccharide heptosyltransferase [Verrucomicrobiaceae bacterium]